MRDHQWAIVLVFIGGILGVRAVFISLRRQRPRCIEMHRVLELVAVQVYEALSGEMAFSESRQHVQMLLRQDGLVFETIEIATRRLNQAIDENDLVALERELFRFRQTLLLAMVCNIADPVVTAVIRNVRREIGIAA